MSVEVMQAQSSLLLAEDSLIEQQSIMAPSPRNIASPRAKHSRNAHGGSIGRARASSNINESEVMMIRALCWILRHGIGGMGAQYGINTAFDVSGWADCGQIVCYNFFMHALRSLTSVVTRAAGEESALDFTHSRRFASSVARQSSKSFRTQAEVIERHGRRTTPCLFLVHTQHKQSCNLVKNLRHTFEPGHRESSDVCHLCYELCKLRTYPYARHPS